MKKSTLFTIFLLALSFSAFGQKSPIFSELREVAQLPAEIPQRVSALAYDGERLWFAIYLDKGRYATFDPQTNTWKYSDSEIEHQSIRRVSQPFSSAAGMVFDGKKLWLSGAYGKSFGYVNIENWQAEKVYKKIIRPDLEETNSQSYADMTFDGKNIWIVWHLWDYKLPASEVQQLLKIEPETGEILQKYALPIVSSRPDGAHGLTFDGTNLWHIKNGNLSAVNLDGKLVAQYKLKEIARPSGMVWDGKSLWITEFTGKLWNLPFTSL